jgi:hypothetical protein
VVKRKPVLLLLLEGINQKDALIALMKMEHAPNSTSSKASPPQCPRQSPAFLWHLPGITRQLQ